MTEPRITAAACRTMAEVRAGVDAIDREIAALIGERFRFMEAAARIKPERGQVRDDPRKAEVIANASRAFAEHGAPVDLAVPLYELLVERSIAFELDAFDRARGQQPG